MCIFILLNIQYYVCVSYIVNKNVRMIVLVFVLVLQYFYVSVYMLCACYVDFILPLHNIPIVFYYFIENVHSYICMFRTYTYVCTAIVLFVACILVLRVLCIVSPSIYVYMHDDYYYYYIVNAFTTPTIHNYFSPKYTRVLFAKTKHSHCIYCSVSHFISLSYVQTYYLLQYRAGIV